MVSGYGQSAIVSARTAPGAGPMKHAVTRFIPIGNFAETALRYIEGGQKSRRWPAFEGGF
jgi:hypothetical protein